MEKITGNEPAMPQVKTTKEDGNRNGKDWFIGNTHSIGGLTIRQHFAAMAMQGFCANDTAYQLAMEELAKKDGDGNIFDEMATSCVQAADALITALNK